MSNEQLEMLERLAKLKQDGMLSDEEFENQKRKVLQNVGIEEISSKKETNYLDAPQENEIKDSSNSLQTAVKPKNKKFNLKKILLALGALIFVSLLCLFIIYLYNERELENMQAQVARNETEALKKQREFENSPSELKEKLGFTERMYPAKYLKISDYKWIQGTIFEPANKLQFKVTNTASVAIYSDVRIKIIWRGSNGEKISEGIFTTDKIQLLYPNKFFTEIIVAPNNQATASLTIESAIGIPE